MAEKQKGFWLKAILTILIAVPLFVVFGPRPIGMVMAYLELWGGDYRVHVYGLSLRNQDVVSLLKDEYGIELRTVACCPHNRLIREHTEGYNSVMKKAIRERFPTEVLKILA